MTSYCYDPNGDKTAGPRRRQHPSGVAACSTSSPYQTSSTYQTAYSYDSLGELDQKTTPRPPRRSGADDRYTYDPAGNLLTTRTRTASRRRTPTPRSTSSHVVLELDAHSVTYSYDANGQVPDERRHRHLDLPTTRSASSPHENGAGKTVSYSYDANGNKTDHLPARRGELAARATR